MLVGLCDAGESATVTESETSDEEETSSAKKASSKDGELTSVSHKD